MLKVGLIGAGFMGGTHAACYKELGVDGVLLTAVADLDNEKAKAVAERTGAKTYSNADDLIANADVDVIDICLPTYLHSEYAIKAMEKVKAVFIEKPVALNKKQAKELLEAQEKTKTQVMVGQCLRLWPEYMWLKETEENGTYGEILSAVFKRVSPKPEWAWDNWLHKVECSGSVALDLHIHDADMVRFIMGEPNEITSKASRDEEGVIQQIFSTYSYNDPDRLIVAEGGWNYPSTFPFCMEYRVKFEKATAVFDSTKTPALVVYTNDNGIIEPEIKREVTETSDVGGNISDLGGYYNELKYFTQQVQAGLPIEIAQLSEGVKSLELVLDEIELAGGAQKV